MKSLLVYFLIVAMSVAAAIIFLPIHSFSHETLTTTVLFDREIVRILDKHCVMCHVDNGPAFPLSTYEETWLRGRPIRSSVLARHMPPWAAVQGYGDFANENRLTLREMQFVVSWVEGLGPRNAGNVFLNVLDPRAVPRQEVRAHVDFGQWELGKPDLTRRLPAIPIEPGQPDAVKRIVIDSGVTAERRIRSFEFMPGDRRVVRAAFFSIQETGQWLGSWTPWYGFVKLPAGVAYRLPSGAHIVAEIHYRSAKDVVMEQGTIGLYFSEERSPKSASDVVVEARGEIPAGASGHRLRGAMRVPVDMHAVALRPEFSAGITSLEVSARRPDGGTDVLLFAKDLPKDWPTPYIFRDPVLLRRGSEVLVTAYYSNSSSAPPAGIRVTISRY